MYDYHTHSTYSDGDYLRSMFAAAEAAGLDGVGVADHCMVLSSEWARRTRREMGFNFDATYDRRREAIDSLRGEFDLEIFDAAEVDYEPGHETEIRSFLADAEFDYAIGSVHALDGANVHAVDHFAALPESRRGDLVETYFEKLVSLVESELFEVAAHPDLIERNPALRGHATGEQYERVADAFADSRTVPEVNAGRVRRDYGEFHPTSEFFEVLAARGVDFALGSDAHDAESIGPLADELRAFADERGLEPARPER
ncbi:PHP domain-containing protein [Halogeometricum sp. S1BR25-6]|uniref:histidinol-phosphatase n=1 Tax=Halogeometricum salsisoli TaxID=2950536 RepID=A0ABU2GFE0_9EURY|nr:PHP domain-containing protein [Halogeometricum sp. S1BR25-6]MDS0299508.1 PHP domain-containing protein [Halogeometricum sp. S1BR25-6]